jgi:hypothetical protein
MVKQLALALVIALVPAAPAMAKKKKKPPTSAEVKKPEKNKAPAPGDKHTNEGAQGRINATEDAAKGADSPQFQRRP